MSSEMSSGMNRPILYILSCLVCLALVSGPAIGPELANAALARKGRQTLSLEDTWNPHPDTADIVLPMPGGIGMAFRLVAVPAAGLLGDMVLKHGIVASDEADRAYYDRPYTSALSAPFTLADLPASWLPAARQAIASASSSSQANAKDGHPDSQTDGSDPNGSGKDQAESRYFFYLIGKYEVSRQQWQAIMQPAVRPENSQASQTAGQSGQEATASMNGDLERSRQQEASGRSSTEEPSGQSSEHVPSASPSPQEASVQPGPQDHSGQSGPGESSGQPATNTPDAPGETAGADHKDGKPGQAEVENGASPANDGPQPEQIATAGLEQAAQQEQQVPGMAGQTGQDHGVVDELPSPSSPSTQPDHGHGMAADADAARPVTDISWFDALEFSRRYTVWLLTEHPDDLPRFAGDSRNTGYLRLPTESEWEYAARGGHKAGIQLLREDFFALPEGDKRSDYAVYRPEDALRIPTGSSAIGSRKQNPLGLYDTAGNVAEMVMDCFRFSVGGRLHGSAGGFVRKGGSWFSGDSAILPGRREEIPFFLASGPASARDMGLRLVISGTNTPGGARPDALHAEWKKAGEGPAIASSRARNPLEELDRLLVLTTDQTTRKNLLALRDSIKESNIMRERQLELEAETVFGTGAYMIETIRNYYSRGSSLENQISIIEADRKQQSGKDLEKLDQLLDNARRGRKQLETSLNRSLAFYQTKVEDYASLDPDVARSASENVARDYSGDGPFDQNMRRNLELFLAHVEAWRKGKAIPREKLKTEIIKKRFR